MFNLARMYEKGDTTAGVPDIDEALMWYEKTLKTDPEFLRCQEKIATLSAQKNTASEAKTERFGDNLRQLFRK